MRKLFYVSTLTSFLTLISCKTEEEKYLDKHHVLLCKTNEFDEFVANAVIKPNEARNLMMDFVNKNNLPKEASLYFIIDDYYAFTNYIHPKIPEAHTGSIWVNAKTGDVKQMKEGIFLKAYHAYKW